MAPGAVNSANKSRHSNNASRNETRDTIHPEKFPHSAPKSPHDKPTFTKNAVICRTRINDLATSDGFFGEYTEYAGIVHITVTLRRDQGNKSCCSHFSADPARVHVEVFVFPSRYF